MENSLETFGLVAEMPRNLLQLVPNQEPLYETRYGAAFVGDSLDFLKHLQCESVNLIMTSPPFALTRSKPYGNPEQREYSEWFVPFAKEFSRILRPDGSLVIDIGGAWLPGLPVKSTYQFALLLELTKSFFLAQDFYWCNPARLPSPAEWVNVRRIRAKDAVDCIWWLSKSPFPKANNRKVLRPYSRSMENLLENGAVEAKRPSGHAVTLNFQRDNNGSIPPNFLLIPNTVSADSYLRKCREAGISPHPARFPSRLPEFFIEFLTEPGDVVLDPFAGSNTTGAVAERLKRYWIAIEREHGYLAASRLRFEP